MRKGGTSVASHKEKMVRSVDNCDESVWSADCPEACPPDCKRWKKTKKSASDRKARLAQTARLMPTTIKPREEAATVRAPAAQLESEVDIFEQMSDEWKRDVTVTYSYEHHWFIATVEGIHSVGGGKTPREALDTLEDDILTNLEDRRGDLVNP